MGKVAVVTGANKGIGLAIVQQLCQEFDGTVYLTARDETRGKAAVEELQRKGCNPKFHQLDITDDSSIANLRAYLEEAYGGLDVLVNNAALIFKADVDRLLDDSLPPCQNDGEVTFAEQATRTITTNYFGTKNVCKALFPILREDARVVNLSSDSGHLSRIAGKEPAASTLRKRLASETLTEDQLDTLVNEFVESATNGKHFEQGWPHSPYEVSKVAISALTRIQQRQLEREGRRDVAVNSVHPGFVDTDATDHRGPMSVTQGSVAAVYLALLRKDPPDELRGGYVWYDKTVVDWVEGPMPPAW